MLRSIVLCLMASPGLASRTDHASHLHGIKAHSNVAAVTLADLNKKISEAEFKCCAKKDGKGTTGEDFCRLVSGECSQLADFKTALENVADGTAQETLDSADASCFPTDDTFKACPKPPAQEGTGGTEQGKKEDLAARRTALSEKLKAAGTCCTNAGTTEFCVLAAKGECTGVKSALTSKLEAVAADADDAALEAIQKGCIEAAATKCEVEAQGEGQGGTDDSGKTDKTGEGKGDHDHDHGEGEHDHDHGKGEKKSEKSGGAQQSAALAAVVVAVSTFRF